MLSATTPQDTFGEASTAPDRDKRGLISTAKKSERALLGKITLTQPNKFEIADDDSSLEELAELAAAADVGVVGTVSQNRARPQAATLFGKGKVEEIAKLIKSENANVFIVDCDLTPAQGRNLESALEVRVIDRTELILDIFARRAKTRQAKLQVELAQLRYQLPRLKRMWTHLDSQAGGGIGLRGPGETQLETDRRLAGERISLLEKQLGEIRRQKHVESVGRAEFETGALVGYTNVGKSALLNALSTPTGEKVYEADQLFATLGASTRKTELGGGRDVLLSDTVGFVRRLPHHLVESFHSTLSEVEEADFLLLVVDAADLEFEEKLASVRKVLGEMDVLKAPQILVLNQCDRLSAKEQEDLQQLHQDAVLTSALTGEGLEDLKARVLALLQEGDCEVEFSVGAARSGKVLSDIAKHGQLLEQNWDAAAVNGHSRVQIRAKLPQRWIEKWDLKVEG